MTVMKGSIFFYYALLHSLDIWEPYNDIHFTFLFHVKTEYSDVKGLK